LKIRSSIKCRNASKIDEFGDPYKEI
jgi:hypothetical protein